MNSTQGPAPQPNVTLPALDCQRFRQQIAGLIAPAEDPGATEEFRAAGARIGALLARHFGAGLDRLKIWDRIGSAIASACAKAPNGEPDKLLSAMLEHCKAEHSVLSDPEFESLLADLLSRSQTWREGLVAYLQSALYAVLVFARERHAQAKEARKAAKPAKEEDGAATQAADARRRKKNERTREANRSFLPPDEEGGPADE